jgi:hypothetical protein
MQQPGQIDPKSSRHSEVQVDCRNEVNLLLFRYSIIQTAEGDKTPNAHAWMWGFEVLTSQLWDEGTISSSFLPVKMSIATK